jgi:hypothetical protein
MSHFGFHFDKRVSIEYIIKGVLRVARRSSKGVRVRRCRVERLDGNSGSLDTDYSAMALFLD